MMRLEMKYKENCHYGIELKGIPLDGESLKILTTNMLNDIRSILCYDYEDGKPWHDVTCVMELIFNNPHEELNGESQKIRFLYDHPVTLLSDFAILTADVVSMTSIRMDLTAGYFQHDYKDNGIPFNDFEKFDCKIVHKKHFHPSNPEMPDD